MYTVSCMALGVKGSITTLVCQWKEISLVSWQTVWLPPYSNTKVSTALLAFLHSFNALHTQPSSQKYCFNKAKPHVRSATITTVLFIPFDILVAHIKLQYLLFLSCCIVHLYVYPSRNVPEYLAISMDIPENPRYFQVHVGQGCVASKDAPGKSRYSKDIWHMEQGNVAGW